MKTKQCHNLAFSDTISLIDDRCKPKIVCKSTVLKFDAEFTKEDLDFDTKVCKLQIE